MIPRSPSLQRDLKTGLVITWRALTGRRTLFRPRRFSWKDAFMNSLIFLVPMTIIFGGAALYAYLALGDMEKTARCLYVGCGLAVGEIWLTKGVFSNELGGSCSETD